MKYVKIAFLLVRYAKEIMHEKCDYNQYLVSYTQGLYTL